MYKHHSAPDHDAIATLLTAPSKIKHNDAAFAMLNCAPSIGGTKWEGLPPLAAFEYYSQLLQLADYPIALNISEQQLIIAQEAIADLVYFRHLFLKFITKDCIEINYDLLIGEINNRCAKRKNKSCYLASGWISEKTGHFVGLKIRLLDNGFVSCSYINQGAGSQFHRPLVTAGKKRKRDYQSYEYKIDLDSELGHRFLHGVVSLNVDRRVYDDKALHIRDEEVRSGKTEAITIKANNRVICHYNEEDLYGLLVACGEQLTTEVDPKFKAVTPQRTGSCTLTNTKSVARDALISLTDITPDQIKRFHFVIKLVSVIEAYKANRQDKCESRLLELAIHELFVRINKHYPEVLSDDDIAICHGIASQIDNTLRLDREKKIAAKCQTKSLPELEGEWYALDNHPEQFSISKEPPITQERSSSTGTQLQLDSNGCEPAEIITYLDQAIAYFIKLEGISRLMQLRDFMHSLASTSGNRTDRYWDKVSPSERNDVISRLLMLANFARVTDVYAQTYMIEVIFIAYDIVAQLSQNIPELKLSESYSLALDNSYTRQDYFDPITAHTIKQIAINFEKRRQDRALIFSNAVNYDQVDHTQNYVMKMLLTNDHRRLALEKLKDLKAIDNSVTELDDNQLFVILLSRSCQASEKGETKQIPFPTEEILGKVFIDILSLAALAQTNGVNLGHYSRPKENSSRDAKLFFCENLYLEHLRAEPRFNPNSRGSVIYSNQQSAVNQFTSAIKKLIPNAIDKSAEHQDFAENVVYHPSDDLTRLREKFHAGQRHSNKDDSAEQPIMPYQIRQAGSLHSYSENWYRHLSSRVERYNEPDQQLKVISASPRLQVQRVLEWAQYHIDQLEIEVIRRRIFNLLFEFDRLPTTLAETPKETMQLIRDFLVTGLQFFQNRTETKSEPTYSWSNLNLKVVLWLAKVQFHLYQHIKVAATLYDFEVLDVEWPDSSKILFEKLTDPKNKDDITAIAYTRMLSFAGRQSLTHDEQMQLLYCSMICQIKAVSISRYKIDPDETVCLAVRIWQQHRDRVLATIIQSDADTLNTLINDLLRNYFNSERDFIWRLEGDFLLADGCDYKIDLVLGQLLQEGRGLRNYTQMIGHDHVFGFMGIKGKELALFEVDSQDKLSFNESIVRTADGRWQFIFYNGSSNIHTVYRFIDIDGKSYKFKLLYELNAATHAAQEYFATKQISNPFAVNIGWNAPDYTYWVASKDNNILFVESKKDRRDSYIRTIEKGWQHLLTSADGYTADGTVLFDLATPQTAIETAWAKRLSKTVGLGGVQISGQILEDGRCRVTRIDLGRLGLNFINVDGQLECEQFPGFYLSATQSISQLHGVQSLVVLKNNRGQNKFMLPVFAFQYSKNLDLEDIIKPGWVIDLGSNGARYFICELDRERELIATSVEGNLYLATLFARLGDYARAIERLNRTSSYYNNTGNLKKLADNIAGKIEHTPLAAAFICKLAVRMYRHTAKWSLDYDRWLGDYAPDIVKEAVERLAFYNKVIGDHKLAVMMIPKYLRLDKVDYIIIDTLAGYLKAKESRSSWFGYSRQSKRIDTDSAHYHLPFITQKLLDYSKWEFFKFSFNSDVLIKKFLSESKPFDDTKHHYQMGRRPLALRIYYDRNNKELNATKERYGFHVSDYPGSEYLCKYYVNLFLDARNHDSIVDRQIRAELYFILRNDQNSSYAFPTVFCSLLYVLEHKSAFADLIIHRGNPQSRSNRELYTAKEVFRAVMLKCYNHMETKSPILNLLTIDSIPYKLKQNQLLENPLLVETEHHFKIAEHSDLDATDYSLNDLLTEYFDISSRFVAEGDFTLDFPGMKHPSLLARRILARLNEGHKQNQQRKKNNYRFQDGGDVNKLAITLGERRREAQHSLHKLKKQLLFVANKTVLDLKDSDPATHGLARNLLIARAAGQIKTLTINDLIFALLNYDVSVLTYNNIYLNQSDIANLLRSSCDYAILQTHIDQIDDALQLLAGHKQSTPLELYQQQLLGTVLNKRRHYKVVEYPEFLVYEYMTKRMLREGQVDILIKLIEALEQGDQQGYRHYLLQFAAGGGKTAVLIPILAKRIARKGRLPVIFNTNELYSIGIEDIPKSFRESFRQNIEVIERELHHTWTIEEFNKLHNDLKYWLAQGKCLYLKPITWHSIHTAKRIAYAEGNEKLGRAAQTILKFFKIHCVKLEDEAHIISESLQATIKTYGPMQTIPLDQQRLIFRYYDLLFAYSDNCDEIAEISGVNNKSKKSVSEEKLRRLQHLLIEHIKHDKCFQDLKGIDFEAYLRQPHRKRPQWLKMLRRRDTALADLVILARAFLYTHLPHILTLQFGKDYGASIHSGDLTVAPKHEGKDVTTHFSDPFLVLALTIQFHNQQGVKPSWILQILKSLKNEHDKEREWHEGITQAQALVTSIIPEQFADFQLEGSGDNDWDELANNLSVQRHPNMIKEFLYRYVMSQIRMPKHRVESTPAHLQAGFAMSLMFTATPGLLETLPVYLSLKQSILDYPFEAEVLDVLLQFKNSEACIIEMTHTPSEFFNELRSRYPKSFKAMTGLIDRGALLTANNIGSVIEAFLEQIDENDQQTAGVYFDGKQMCLKSHNSLLNDIKIPGSKLLEALRQKGINPSEFLLYLFIDLSKTTGTDVKRPHDDRVGLTIGKMQTLTETVQAAMRERQLLWDDAQTVIWLIFKGLYAEIYPDAEQFDLKQVWYWMIENEAKETETKLVMRAYQGIYQLLEGIVWEGIDNGILKYRHYHNQLQLTCSLSPWVLYEIESEMKASRQVLEAYVIETCNFFSLNARELPPDIKAKLQLIIDQTCDLVAEMRQPHGAELNSQVCQEQMAVVEEKQEAAQEQKLKSRFNLSNRFKFKLEIYNKSDSLASIFQPQHSYYNSRYRPISLKGCSHIKLPSLLICADHFSPIDDTGYSYGKSRPTKNELNWLKPINTLVVKIDQDDNLQFLACTAAGAEYFYQQIKSLDLSAPDDPDHRYALIGFNGKIFCASKSIDDAMRQAVAQSSALRQIITFIAFLDGRIKNPLVLREIVKQYHWSKYDYNRLVSAIADIHVSHNVMNVNNIEHFGRLCGWHETHDSRLRVEIKTDLKLNHKPIRQHVTATLTLTPNINLPNRVTASVIVYGPSSILPSYLFGVSPTAQPSIHYRMDASLAVAADNSLDTGGTLSSHEDTIEETSTDTISSDDDEQGPSGYYDDEEGPSGIDRTFVKEVPLTSPDPTKLGTQPDVIEPVVTEHSAMITTEQPELPDKPKQLEKPEDFEGSDKSEQAHTYDDYNDDLLADLDTAIDRLRPNVITNIVTGGFWDSLSGCYRKRKELEALKVRLVSGTQFDGVDAREAAIKQRVKFQRPGTVLGRLRNHHEKKSIAEVAAEQRTPFASGETKTDKILRLKHK